LHFSGVMFLIMLAQELFYDPVSRTGSLESYIRQRRSRCPDIITRPFQCRNRLVCNWLQLIWKHVWQIYPCVIQFIPQLYQTALLTWVFLTGSRWKAHWPHGCRVLTEDKSIQTVYTLCTVYLMCCRTAEEENVNGDDDINVVESSLRERRPTAGNMDELLEMLRVTRASRREWIESSKPTISEIFKKYPRLTDVPNAVSWFSFFWIWRSIFLSINSGLTVNIDNVIYIN